MVPVYEAVRLMIADRFCTVDVMEVPDEVPLLIGEIPLEFLDFVVDPQIRRLIGNPAHNGEHTLELYEPLCVGNELRAGSKWVFTLADDG